MASLSHLVGRLRFRQLALLAAIGEHGNLHKAAQAVHLAQPSATKLVRDLERLFGVPLFERLPRGVHPTEFGVEAVAFAKRMLVYLQRFSDDLEKMRQGGYGQLVIGAIMGAAPDFVIRALADIKRQRPLLSVRLVGETSDSIVEWLLRGTIDLAIGRFSNYQQHNSIEYEAVGNDSVCIVARADHPLSRTRNLKFSMLETLPWILQPLASPTRQILEEEFGLAGMKTPADTVECTSVFTTLQLIQTTDAVAMLPEAIVRDYLQTGLLMRLPVTVGKSVLEFGILSRRGEPKTAMAEEFVQALQRHGAFLNDRQVKHPRRSRSGRLEVPPS